MGFELGLSRWIVGLSQRDLLEKSHDDDGQPRKDGGENEHVLKGVRQSILHGDEDGLQKGRTLLSHVGEVALQALQGRGVDQGVGFLYLGQALRPEGLSGLLR